MTRCPAVLATARCALIAAVPLGSLGVVPNVEPLEYETVLLDVASECVGDNHAASAEPYPYARQMDGEPRDSFLIRRVVVSGDANDTHRIGELPVPKLMRGECEAFSIALIDRGLTYEALAREQRKATSIIFVRENVLDHALLFRRDIIIGWYDRHFGEDTGSWCSTVVPNCKIDRYIEHTVWIHDKIIAGRQSSGHPCPLIDDVSIMSDVVQIGSRVSGILGGTRAGSGILEPFAHVSQLPDEQTGLNESDETEPERICRYGVCRRPLPPGFISLMLGACALGLLTGLGIGWMVDRSGDHRKRSRKRDADEDRTKD